MPAYHDLARCTRIRIRNYQRLSVGTPAILLLLLVWSAQGCGTSGPVDTSHPPVVTPGYLVFEPGQTQKTFAVSESSAELQRSLNVALADQSRTPWITSLTPSELTTNGTTPTTVTVTVDPSGVTSGAYWGSVAVSTASDASGENASQASVAVYLIVGSGDDPNDPFCALPSEIDFGTNRTTMTIQLISPYDGVDWDGNPTDTWISVSPNHGSTWPPPGITPENPQGDRTPLTYDVQISVNRTGLPNGLYTGWVLFSQKTSVMLKVTMSVGTAAGGP